MEIHYLYNILLLFVFAFSKGYLKFIILITYPLFLLFLPDTGHDFSHYERAFETIFYSEDSILFFRSRSAISAEPGWFFYNGLISFITGDFRVFLVINLAISIFILLKAFDLFGINKEDQSLMLLFMVPVIFPTLFFWSPRSSISFALALLSLAYTYRERYVLALFFALFSSLIHSQYLPVLGLVNLCLALSKMKVFRRNKLAVIFFVITGMLVMFFNVGFLVSLLSFLPSSNVIAAKTHHLTSRESGFRVTSLLSIIIFPAFIYIFRRKIKGEGLFVFVSILAAFGFIVNVIFFQNPHVAGRLSRLSDYFLFAYLISCSFYFTGKLKYFVFLFILTTYPLVFQDLYPLELFTNLF